jgi:hypothetical protein
VNLDFEISETPSPEGKGLGPSGNSKYQIPNYNYFITTMAKHLFGYFFNRHLIGIWKLYFGIFLEEVTD